MTGVQTCALPISTDKEPGQDRGTNTAAERLRARMAELGKQVRKDDERDRDRTKDRDLDRGGPGR